MEPKSPTGTSGKTNGDAGAGVQVVGDEALGELSERMEELNERVVEFIRARPATALLIAAGLGFLIGRLLRA